MQNKYSQFRWGDGTYGLGLMEHKEGTIYDFMPYLPWVYNVNGLNTRKLLNNVIGIEYTNELQYAQEVAVQRDVSKATWGLSRWEKELGLPSLAISADARRGRILSKISGNERTTNEVLKKLAKDILNTTIDIEEYINEFHIDIKITGQKGTPENAPFFNETLEDIIPAHLTFEILYDLITYGMLRDILQATHAKMKSDKVTYGEIDEYRADEIK